MTVFYIGAALLLLMGLLFVFWPWLPFRSGGATTGRRSGDKAVNRQSVNIASYRDHLTDLDNARVRGDLDQASFDKLKQELEHNLLEDSTATVNTPAQRNPLPLAVAAFLIVIPLMAIVLYQLLGDAEGWRIKTQLQAQAELEQTLSRSLNAPTDPAGHSAAVARELEQLNRQLVANLQDYVTHRPDNLDTQVLLARNAMGIGEYAIAIDGYRQVLQRQPEAPQVLAELAQAIFMEADNRAVPAVGMLAQQALALQPDNLMALSLLGIFNFQSERYADAITYWQRAIARHPPDSPNGRALQNGIVQARSRLEAAEPVVGGSSGAERPPTSADAASIRVAVSLADGLDVDPEHTVFIYARAWQGARMPLAITRIKAARLPLTLELNDAMAMAPGMNLSSSEQVELVARISATGNAIPQPDDLEVTLGPVSPGADPALVYPLIIPATATR